MGFRPMPDILDTSISVYNDSASQLDATSSLRIYKNSENSPRAKVSTMFLLIQDFLTQLDLTYTDECSPTQPASSLRISRSCQFSWSDIVANDGTLYIRSF